MALCMRYAQDRAEAEDMLQEGWIRVFDNIKSFRFQGSLEGWIRKVMVTTALKQLRKAKPTEELNFSHDFEESPELPDAIAHLQEQEIIRHIEGLPEGYRIVFNLYVIEGYRHTEIAELLGIEESTSRSQLVKARKWLQEKILAATRTILL
jgi:RNA polymerase sigma factor (sigma-70 family)